MPPRRQKTYVVMNPNHIPEGISLIVWREHEWKEGDEMTPPAGMSIERLLRDGYIAEKGAGDG